MNVISFSLFKDCPDWMFPFYLKGVEYNIRMAKLLFPEWKFTINIAPFEYSHLTQIEIQEIRETYNVWILDQPVEAPRCQSMLWRLLPMYHPNVERVICRDLDSLLTYRDLKSVERWIASDKIAHGMNDNPAHGGMKLMGGMCGFKAKEFKEKFPSWEALIEGYDLSQHGSDQLLLNQKVYPAFKDSFYFDETPQHYPYEGLAESDLCVRHIGSAGINEMETLRFLHKHEARFSK